MNFHPKKSLGQHFLKDRQIARKIVGAIDAGPDDRVIEIGPGTGALTGLLADRYSDLHVFEVDRRFIAHIERSYPDVAVHPHSFLDAGMTVPAGSSGRIFVIGNLPYYLTSPVLFRILDQGDIITQAVFMIQKEVAERLVAKPGTKSYGILSVQAQVLGRIELLFPVSRHVFQPPPKVESAVISWRSGNDLYPGSVRDLPVPPDIFKRVVRTAFQQRRKKLSNALKELFGTDFPEGFNAGLRAENLRPREFVALAEHLVRSARKR